MKKTLLLYYIILPICFLKVQGQQRLYFEVGFTNASFENFENNKDNNTLDNQYGKTTKNSFGGGVLINIFKKQRHYDKGLGGKIKWDSGFKYNNYDISTHVIVSPKSSFPINYDLSFLTLKTGLNVSFLTIPFINYYNIKFQVHSHLSHDWLIYGERSFRGEVVNLKEDKEFYQTLFNYHLGIGAEFMFTDTISFYANYDLKRSFKKNAQNNNEEQYQIYANTLNFGIRINIGST